MTLSHLHNFYKLGHVSVEVQLGMMWNERADTCSVEFDTVLYTSCYLHSLHTVIQQPHYRSVLFLLSYLQCRKIRKEPVGLYALPAFL